MKISFEETENPYILMRKCGYRPERKDEKTGELIFVRRISASGYPRFHAYVKVGKVSRQTLINLHLDQKKPVYKGSPAHGAEYEGGVVEKEAERIRQIAGQ